MRRFVADTLAMIIFSTVVAMMIEIAIAGMTVEQSVQTRLIAAPVNLATGWIYGLFRDWLFRLTRTDMTKAGWISKTVLDTMAFVIFQMPLYAGILYTAGATPIQIVTASSTATLSVAPLGRPYGMFLDYIRRLFRVTEIAKLS